MSNLISGSRFTQAAALHLSFGLMLMGLAGAAQAAETEEDFFEPKLDLLTTRLAHSGAGLLPNYQFSASVVLNSTSDTATIGAKRASAFPLPPVVEPQQGTAGTTNALWQQTHEGGHLSLQRLLSVSLKAQQANITIRPRSISLEGEQLKITFRPQSAVIEKDQLKITLNSHSVTTSWSKAF